MLSSIRSRLILVFIVVICAVITAAKFGATSMVRTEWPPPVKGALGARPVEINTRTALGQQTSVRPDDANSKIVNLQPGRDLKTQNLAEKLVAADIDMASARPLTLASDDLNQDGYPDLIAGYGTGNGGFLMVYYGSERAFAPSDAADLRDQIANRFPEPFARSLVIQLDHAPDLLTLGDFDRNTTTDIMTAAIGGRDLYFISGGSDGFDVPRSVPVGGEITALTAGRREQSELYGEIWVAINGESGPQLLDLGHHGSIFAENVRVSRLAAPASSLELGRLDSDSSIDVALIANGELYIQHGDGKPFGGRTSPPDARAGQLEAVDVPFSVAAVAVSDFIWDRSSQMELAVAGTDGGISILSRGELDKRAFSPAEALARRGLTSDARDGKRGRTQFEARNSADRWIVAESGPENLNARSSSSRPMITGMLASAQNSYDLLTLDAASNEIGIAFRQDDGAERALSRFQTASEPVAVLPMRLNMHGHAGLVVLQNGKSEPTLMMFEIGRAHV
jgi:hypothetical protein